MKEESMETNVASAGKRTTVPACNIVEDSGFVTVKLEMPGVPKEALEVRIEGNVLSVSGERRREEPRGKYLLRERRAEGFRKTFTLDETIARDKVDAALVDGILTLKLQVKEAAKPRKIEIA
jgi:HSP20 family protein